jgi:hypothetical protein
MGKVLTELSYSLPGQEHSRRKHSISISEEEMCKKIVFA